MGDHSCSIARLWVTAVVVLVVSDIYTERSSINIGVHSRNIAQLLVIIVSL